MSEFKEVLKAFKVSQKQKEISDSQYKKEDDDDDDDDNDDDDDDEEEEEDDEDVIQNGLSNLNDLLCDTQFKNNPCACLLKEKCLFRNYISQTNLNLNNDEDFQKASKLLQFKCINESCKNMCFNQCLASKNKKQNQFILTKCKSCYDTSVKPIDKIFKFISDKQE